MLAMVLLAALLHATWNALLKSGTDGFRAMVIMSMTSGIVALPAILVLPFPAPASWPAILLSAVIHVAYNLFLVASYRYGDLGQVYPVARGASPLLVTVGALMIAGERLDPLTLSGIVLVSLGIMSLAQGWTREAGFKGILTALATGGLIAAYTVCDGIGGRFSLSPPSYAAWLFFLDTLPLPAIYWVARRKGPPLFDRSFATLKAASGGLVSMAAYAIVIEAASVTPMGKVSALRETSVVFAALIGRFYLQEPLTVRRLLSCVTVGAGAVLMAYR